MNEETCYPNAQRHHLRVSHLDNSSSTKLSNSYGETDASTLTNGAAYENENSSSTIAESASSYTTDNTAVILTLLAAHLNHTRRVKKLTRRVTENNSIL